MLFFSIVTEDPNGMKKKILYVDDELINTTFFKEIFGYDYEVIVANSGAEALEKLQDESENVAIVITDFKMPEMNGIEMIQSIKEKYGNVPSLVISGYTGEDEIQEALEDKMLLDALSKPYSHEQVKEIIDDCIEC